MLDVNLSKTKHKPYVFFSLLGHEYYDGSCPEFTSMEGFDWSRFTGDWWTILKMNTRSSCMRYSYGVDDGERYVIIHVSNLTLVGIRVKK